MAASKADPSLLERLRDPEDRWAGIARDLIWVVGVVALIALALFLVSGTWPAVVAIESGSMVPNMNVGDLVLVVSADRFGNLTTSEDGALTGYGKFNANPNNAGEYVYGDVIVYQPNGATNIHPIIHRALDYVNESEAATLYRADHAGYITKGDHNDISDQNGTYPGIGRIQPVKREWIIGKALFVIPAVGLLPLNLPLVAAIVIGLMLLYELWSWWRRKEPEPEPARSKKGSKQGKGR
ncbi:MAG: S26 family signal peptidase [Methanospirillum sp.]